MPRLNPIHSKHGQITILIIIGVVLLIAASFITYIFMQESEQAQPIEEIVRFEYEGQKEIYNYVMACLKPAVIEGLEIMRLQAGYIYVPDDMEVVVVKDSEDRVVRPDDSGTLRVYTDPSSPGNRKPYWIGSDYVGIPSMDFLEGELKSYVETELERCVADFEIFRQQGYEIAFESPIVNPQFETAVLMDVIFPIHAKKADLEFDLQDFVYTVPVDWPRILHAASNIVAHEMTETYLEYFTNNLISLYSGIDANKLPPFSATSAGFACDSVTWDMDKVQAMLAAVIYQNMPHIKIDQTNYTSAESASASESQGIYDSFVYDIIDSDMSLHINHTYSPSWGMNFDITPKSGNMIKPDITRGVGLPMLSVFCSIKYQFKYFVQYPTLISIEHDNSAKLDPSLNSFSEMDGYMFAFPIKVVIYGNQKRQYTELNLSMLSELEDEASGGAADVSEMRVVMDDFFCDSGQRGSHNISVVVMDAETGELLEGAEIFYKIPIDQASLCHIGTTGDLGRLKSQFPVCHNCEVMITKQGYVSTKKFMTSADREKFLFSFTIEPLKELALDVNFVHLPTFMRNYYETDGYTKAHNCTDESADSLLAATIVEPEAGDHAIITFDKRDIIVHTPAVVYPLTKNISISKGKYDVKYLVMGQTIIESSTIGGQEVSMNKNESSGKYEGTYQGQYVLGTASYSLDISDIYGKSAITLLAPIEYKSSEANTVSGLADNILIQDELKYSFNHDHDCNMTTPDVERTLEISRWDFAEFFQPVLS